NNLRFDTSYDLVADSLKWQPLRFSGSIPIVEKLDLNFAGTLNPYALDNNNRMINTFNIDNGGSLFRLTNINGSLNYSFSSRDFEKRGRSNEDNRTFNSGGRPDDLFGDSNDMSDTGRLTDKPEEENVAFKRYNYSIPWDLRLAYTISYNNQRRENEIASHSLMFSGNVDLSPRWSVGASSGYDFKGQGITFTQFRFLRDLESWHMRFIWVSFSDISL